jgi:hypothetical protein
MKTVPHPSIPLQVLVSAGWSALLLGAIAMVGSNAGLAQPLYRVEVLAADAATLKQVRVRVPDAFLVPGANNVPTAIAGTFAQAENAQTLANELRSMGLQNTAITQLEKGDGPQSGGTGGGGTSAGTTVATAAMPSSATPSSVAPSESPPTPPEASPAPADGQRPYLTLVHVADPTAAEMRLSDVRRYFPTAQPTQFQGQAAIETGSFSQLSQARLQADELTSQGFDAVTVRASDLNTAIAQVPDAPTPTATGSYWVLVSDPMGDKFGAVQRLIPSSSQTTFNQQAVIRTGEFTNREEALDQVAYLATQGYEAGAFPAADGANSSMAGDAAAPPSQPPTESTTALPESAAVSTSTQPVAPSAPTAPVSPAPASPTGDAAPAASASMPAIAPLNTQQYASQRRMEEFTAPTATTASNTTAPVTFYWVLVPTNQQDGILDRAKSVAADAFIRQWEGATVVQVGTYRERPSAEAALQKLSQLGLSGQLVEQQPG